MSTSIETGNQARITVRPGVSAPNRITADIRFPSGRAFAIETVANVNLDGSSTPWLAASLPAAMKLKTGLVIDGEVDGVAAENADRAQAILSGWFPRHYPRVPVETRATSGTSSAAKGVGSFFSGGVDSFYTAITQHERITHLIYVHGLDIRPDDDELGGLALGAAREAAGQLGKPLIEVTTTLRSAFGDPLRIPWGHVFHGPALAHVAAALSPHLGTVVIPSSYSTAQLRPWGSHPELDPCWSTSVVDIEHRELDVDRFDKISRIVDSPIAMNHLRVCWENRDGKLNCEKCFKCFRTRLGIMFAGGECATLSSDIDPKTVRRMYIDASRRQRLREALVEFDERGIDEPELERAMRSAIRRSYVLQYIAR